MKGIIIQSNKLLFWGLVLVVIVMCKKIPKIYKMKIINNQENNFLWLHEFYRHELCLLLIEYFKVVFIAAVEFILHYYFRHKSNFYSLS